MPLIGRRDRVRSKLRLPDTTGKGTNPMSSAALELTPPKFRRRFVSEGEALDSFAAIEPYFQKLLRRPLETADDLVRWLEDGSELAACIEEVGTHRYVRMTCHTDDAAIKAAYLDFVENIEPRCKPLFHELNVRYTKSTVAAQLPRPRFAVLDRAIRAGVELFRPENVALQVEEARLRQKFQEICGAQTVFFDGKEQTLSQLAAYGERTDRALRQKAWEAEVGRRLQDVAAIEDIFDELIRLRHRMAQNAGCADYRDYAFRARQRFDYTPEDCIAFHAAVESVVVPVARELERERKAELGVEPLRPWDLAVDVKGRHPLQPFQSAGELCTRTSRVFHCVDPELGNQFDEIHAAGHLDLESRKGKAPGGYQAAYEESRHPFIFMNAVGLQRDVRTLIHEGGHAFHQVAARHDPILMYRGSPIEFAEVASFGMEMLALDYLDEFYPPQEQARAVRAQLEGIIQLFPWVATIDAFQHWLYADPSHTRDQRREHWLALRRRFGGIADYTGYEEALACSWHRQHHLFDVPFYYIEYAIAKLGALQIWSSAMKDRPAATRRYREALALGGSRPLPDLFAAAGACFDFSEQTLAPLIDLVSDRLRRLPV